MKSNLLLFTLSLFAAATFLQSCSRSQQALWIESIDDGEPRVTVAMTKGIAGEMLASEHKVNFSRSGKKDLVTRESIQAVLDGRRSEVVLTDPDDGSRVRMYMKRLRVPGNERGGDRLVLETYKSGEKTFSITLPQVEIQTRGESAELVNMTVGWKDLLPFLAKVGGAVYAKDLKDGTEFWLYVE